MALSKAQIKALFDEIKAIPKSFDLTLDDAGKFWFVDRVVRSLQTGTSGTSDADIPVRVKDIVVKTKAIVGSPEVVDSPADIQLKISVKDKSAQWFKDSYPRRVEIIYGAIAVDPTLVQPANKKFLDLVIRRRFRAIARMALWVNGDDSPPLFQFPNQQCDLFRINKAALPLWNSATPHKLSGFTLPRWTIKVPASGHVIPAVEKLWEEPAGTCDGNVLECATAMTTVLMDSLLEVKDPDALLRALHARGQRFLAICNPTLPDADETFVLDQGPGRAFTTENGSMEDLQVGDYVYLWNHALYLLFTPRGGWRGEHALILACGDRDPMTGFKLTGHGVSSKTIAGLRATLLAVLQSNLDTLYVVGQNFLAFLEAGAPQLPNVTVQSQQLPLGGTLVETYFYTFDLPLSYLNYTLQPIRSEVLPHHIIVYVPSRQMFGLHRSIDDIVKATTNPDDSVVLRQLPNVATGSQYDPVNWVLRYDDAVSGGSKDWHLFERHGGRLSIKQIRNADMPDPPIARSPGQAGVRIVGPTKRPTTTGAF